MTFAVFGDMFLFQLRKPLIHHSLLVSLIISTLFSVALHLGYSKTSVCSKLLSYGCHSVSLVFPFSPTFEISSLAHCMISHHFQILHHCLSNSIFWGIFIFNFHAFFSTQAQKAPFIWFSRVVCCQC